MKLKWLGALIGALLLAAAAPAGATPVGVTVNGTTDITNLGAFAPGAPVLNFGSGALGKNGETFGNGKTYFDYIFSFTLTGTSKVTIGTGVTSGSNILDFNAGLFNSSPVFGALPGGSALTMANPSDPLGLTNTSGLLTLGTVNGGNLGTLTLTAGTYYLRLFGILPGNINAGHGLTGINSSLTVAATPIPAALPLFGTALGLMGFFGWRRKSTAAAVAA